MINFRSIIQFIKINFFYLIYSPPKKIVSCRIEKNIDTIKSNFINASYKIYIMNQSRVFTNTINDTAYLYKNSLLKEPSYQYRYDKNNLIKNGNINLNIVLKKGTPAFVRRIDKTLISLLSGGAAKVNYWHWMFDSLPKIGILEKKIDIKNYLILAPSLKKKFQIETLLALGFKYEQLINGEKFKHISAKNILATDHPIDLNNNPSISILNMPNWIINWHRNKFLNKVKKLNFACDKIYIDKQNNFKNNNRIILNNDELKEFLAKEGFKIIDLNKHSFIEQISLFNRAKIIISIHGAGLTNVIFSKPKTKIIEICSESFACLFPILRVPELHLACIL